MVGTQSRNYHPDANYVWLGYLSLPIHKVFNLAQFFEKRYSRKFRIFTGIVAFTAGIINFGIFPAVGAQFFISYCGFPDSFLGIPVYPLMMIVLLGISLYFVYTGGQIAVIIADFFQGVFATVVLVVVALYLFFNISWDQVSESLEQTPVKLANEEIEALKKDDSFLILSDLDQQVKTDEIREKYENSSRINPFRTSHVEDFNFWYFLIGIIGILYGSMSWQGSQAYNSSAKSAHEAKMGSVLAGFRAPSRAFFLLVPCFALCLHESPRFYPYCKCGKFIFRTVKYRYTKITNAGAIYFICCFTKWPIRCICCLSC